MYQNHTSDIPGLGDQINLADAVEVELWSKLLGLQPDELKQAVEVVGSDYGDLVAYLADALIVVRARSASIIACRTASSARGPK